MEKEKVEVKFDKTIFEAPVTDELLLKYLRVYRSRQRQGTSSVKTRAEVSGGGIKPWKQKGTGRARAGSRRAPHWVHGGIAHGPKPKDWSLKLPAQMKKVALKSALSLKNQEKQLHLISGFNSKSSKLKNYISELAKLNLPGKTLLVVSNDEKEPVRFLRNVANLKVTNTQTLNVYDILNAKNVVFTKDSLIKLKERV